MKKWWLFFLLTGFFAIGCSDDDDKEVEGGGEMALDVGQGKVVVPKDGAIKLKLTNAGSYAVVPFHVGNIANVDGAVTGSEAAFTVNSGLSFVDPEQDLQESLYNDVPVTREAQIDRLSFLRKLVLNRFMPSQGITAEIEALATAHDELMERLSEDDQDFQRFELTSYLADEATRVYKPMHHAGRLGLVANDCPAKDTSIAVVGGTNFDIKSVISQDGFCILVGEETASGYSEDNLKKAMTTILSIYKDTIYKDSFDKKGNLVFKPYIMLTDFSSHNALNPSHAGVFIASMTETLNRPAIYMNAGLAANDEFYATLAHEMQHAIMFYKKGQPDSIYIDEGLAHLMENLFGYKDAGEHAKYTGSYLIVKNALPAVRATLDSSTDNVSRGGGHALMYYLATQAGGFTFSGGAVSGGDGLEFIRKVVSSSKTKLSNVAEVFGSSSWVVTMGNYFGALVADNASVAGIESKFTLPDYSAVSLKDVLGNSNKAFGFRFNSASNPGGDVSSLATLSAANKNISLMHYTPKPFKFVATGSANNLDLSSAADGAGVVVLRFK